MTEIKFCIKREKIENNEGNHASSLGSSRWNSHTLQIISCRTRDLQSLDKVNFRNSITATRAKKTEKSNTILKYSTVNILTTKMSEKIRIITS